MNMQCVPRNLKLPRRPSAWCPSQCPLHMHWVAQARRLIETPHFPISRSLATASAAMSGFYDEIKASEGVFKAYVNGAWFETTSKRGQKILNPSTNETAFTVQGMIRLTELNILRKVLLALISLYSPSGRVAARSKSDRSGIWPCTAPINTGNNPDPPLGAACTKEEVDSAFKAAKEAQRTWAKTPLWKRAEYLHKVDALMKASGPCSLLHRSCSVVLHSIWPRRPVQACAAMLIYVL